MVEIDIGRVVASLDSERVRDSPLEEKLGGQIALDVPREARITHT
jgi:hypothetical protein